MDMGKRSVSEKGHRFRSYLCVYSYVHGAEGGRGIFRRSNSTRGHATSDLDHPHDHCNNRGEATTRIQGRGTTCILSNIPVPIWWSPSSLCTYTLFPSPVAMLLGGRGAK